MTEGRDDSGGTSGKLASSLPRRLGIFLAERTSCLKIDEFLFPTDGLFASLRGRWRWSNLRPAVYGNT